MGISALSRMVTADGLKGAVAPVAAVIALARSHCSGLLVRCGQNVIFGAYHVIAGPVEANHNDKRR